MQDRYTGDIGDFAKYGLLRALGVGHRLGVAWYLMPDETHNGDGRHVDYLADRPKWAPYDPDLFDTMKALVAVRRSVATVEGSGLLPGAVFHSKRLEVHESSVGERWEWRSRWFEGVLSDLIGCDLVFADPDNGLCLDDNFRASRRSAWKRIPVAEVLRLAQGRTAIIYHHNTRRPGGHELENGDWIKRLGGNVLALRWRRISCRTFFVVNPTPAVSAQVMAFTKKWAPHFSLQDAKRCLETA
jgi:hypothetical protein